jgi:hypothetical protein
VAELWTTHGAARERALAAALAELAAHGDEIETTMVSDGRSLLAAVDGWKANDRDDEIGTWKTFGQALPSLGLFALLSVASVTAAFQYALAAPRVIAALSQGWNGAEIYKVGVVTGFLVFLLSITISGWYFVLKGAPQDFADFRRDRRRGFGPRLEAATRQHAERLAIVGRKASYFSRGGHDHPRIRVVFHSAVARAKRREREGSPVLDLFGYDGDKIAVIEDFVYVEDGAPVDLDALATIYNGARS